MNRKAFPKLIIVVSLVAALAIVVPMMSGCLPRAAAPPEVAPPEVAPPEPAAEPIKVGFIAPLSGPAALGGEEAVRGARLAQKEINAAGGILGRPMELIILDTKAYVDERPAELVDELALKHNVLWISGGFSDSIGWPVRERAAYREVPYLGWVPWDSMSTRGENLHPWLWVTGPDTEAMAWMTIPYLLSNDLVPKDFVTLGPDYEWGWSNSKSAIKPIEAFGGNVVAEVFTPVPTIKFDTIVAQIQELLPQGGTIVDTHFGAGMIELMSEVYAAGLLDKGYAFVKTTVYGPSTYSIIPQEQWEGVWAYCEYYPYVPDNQIHLEWIERHVAESGVLPGTLEFHNYVTLHAIADGINMTGSLDPDVWIPAVQGEVLTGLVTDGEYMFQDLTGRLLWPSVVMRGKVPEDKVDIFPTIPEIGPEWDMFEIMHTFDVDYQLAIIPEEVYLEGTEIGGPGIGDGVLDYWK